MISELGLCEQSLEWLIALSINGQKLDGYELKMFDLLAKWISEALDVKSDEHQYMLPVIQLCQDTVRYYICFFELCE